MREAGPLTSDEVAARTGLNERRPGDGSFSGLPEQLLMAKRVGHSFRSGIGLRPESGAYTNQRRMAAARAILTSPCTSRSPRRCAPIQRTYCPTTRRLHRTSSSSTRGRTNITL